MSNMLKSRGVIKGKNTSSETFDCDPDELAAKMEELDTFLKVLCAGPHEAMALLTTMLEFYKDKFGVKAVSASENPPQ